MPYLIDLVVYKTIVRGKGILKSRKFTRHCSDPHFPLQLQDLRGNSQHPNCLSISFLHGPSCISFPPVHNNCKYYSVHIIIIITSGSPIKRRTSGADEWFPGGVEWRERTANCRRRERTTRWSQELLAPRKRSGFGDDYLQKEDEVCQASTFINPSIIIICTE